MCLIVLRTLPLFWTIFVSPFTLNDFTDSIIGLFSAHIANKFLLVQRDSGDGCAGVNFTKIYFIEWTGTIISIFIFFGWI